MARTEEHDRFGRVVATYDSVCPRSSSGYHFHQMDRVLRSGEHIEKVCDRCRRPIVIAGALWATRTPVAQGPTWIIAEPDALEDLC